MGACCSNLSQNASQQPVNVIIKISQPPKSYYPLVSDRKSNKKFQNIDFSDNEHDQNIKMMVAQRQNSFTGPFQKVKLQGKQTKNKQHNEKTNSRHHQIVEEDNHDNSLWKLNHQLSTMVCTFENNYGSISFITDHSNDTNKQNKKSYRITDKKKTIKKDTVFTSDGIGLEKNNLKKKKRKDTQIDEKNTNLIQNIKFRKITENQSEQNIDFNVSSIQESMRKMSRSLKKISNKRNSCNRLQSDKIISNLINKDMPLEKIDQAQLKQGNCKSDLDIQSNINSQTQDNEQAISSKSLKINKDKWLDSSLATDRIQEKNIFYEFSSVINGNIFQKWDDLNSKGVELNIKKYIRNYCFDQKCDQKCEQKQKREKYSSQQKINSLEQFAISVLGAIETYSLHHGIKLISYKDIPFQSYQLRLFLNGMKRSFKYKNAQKVTKEQFLIGIIKLFEQLYSQQQKHRLPCFAISYLTGWIPQCIQLQDIPMIASMLDRINSNFSEGQTIITFSKTSNFQPKQSNNKLKSALQTQKYFYLVEIDSDSRLLKIATLKTLLKKRVSEHCRKSIKFDTKKRKSTNNSLSQKKLDQNGQILVSWDSIVENFDVLNVNWNPSIYDFSFNFQGIISQQKPIFQSTNKFSNLRNDFPQYLLKIPPNKDDLQLRLLLQIHMNKQSHRKLPKIWFQLYDFHEFRVYNSAEAIRKTLSDKKVSRADMISDVFVFEAAQQQTQYSLVIVAQNLEDMNEEEAFYLYTLSLYSFFEIGAKPLKNQFANKLPEPIVKSPLSQCSFLYHQFGMQYNGKQSSVAQNVIQAKLTQKNYGHSINSPFFANNLHFSIRVPPLTKNQIIFECFQKDQKVFSPFTFDINIIADPLHMKDIVKIPLDILLNQNYRSSLCHGIGGCEFISKHEHYIVVIAGYSGIDIDQIKDCNLRIKCLTQLTNQNEISKKQQVTKIQGKQICFQPMIIFQESFTWLPTHFGPRKRHKMNSSPSYYPISTFQEFFNNPMIEHFLEAGKYQINVSSLTYKDQFMMHPHYQPTSQTQSNEQQDKSILSLSELQAPTLSLSIMRMSGDMKSCKIILDDAFYVPFGMGFWSMQLNLQAGIYRFICPKIQQEISEQGSEGLLSIRKIMD